MQDRVDELRETLATAQRQALEVEGPAATALGSVLLALHQVAAMLEELGMRSPGADPLSPSESPAGRAVGVHDAEELTGTAEAGAAAVAGAAPLDNLAEAGGEAPTRGV